MSEEWVPPQPLLPLGLGRHPLHPSRDIDQIQEQSCQVLNLHRSSYRYQSVADEQAVLRIRLKDLAQARVSYGYRRLHVLLQREGWQVNHKRVYRLYLREGLMLRPKKPKQHVSGQKRMERPVATGADESWSMDFVSDELFDGRRIRL